MMCEQTKWPLTAKTAGDDGPAAMAGLDLAILAISSNGQRQQSLPSHYTLSSRLCQDPADDLSTRIAEAREEEHRAKSAWLASRAAGRPLAETCRLRQIMLNLQALRYLLERRETERGPA